ncbi:MAG: TRAP transporter substrate-binding protein [Beijerinckiaceae bacterium]
MMNKRKMMMTTVAALLAQLAMSSTIQAQTRTFSFGYDQPKSTGYGLAADIFDAKLKELSGGKMSINQFPAAQLGQEPVMLQKVRSGDIDFIISSSANASTLAPASGVMSLHYIFRDEAHLTKAIASPELAAAVKDIFSDVTGARILTIETLGLRNIYSKFNVEKVGDIVGKKIRVQATKTEDMHFSAYKAQVVHMPFGEVYTSLQTGVTDAAENGVNVYFSNKHYEVAPVLSLTQHEANNGFIWVSDKTWNSLNDQEKGWVTAAAKEVGDKQPAMALKLELESVEKLKKMGVRVVENVDKSGFMNIAKPVQDQIAAELGPKAVKVLEIIRNIK